MNLDRQEHAYLTAEQVDGYYEQLVAKYWQQLNSFIQRRTSNQQDAEDIVQEAFVHAYYALERYPLQQIRTLQARPWLYKITWNVYRNYMSRTKPPIALSLDDHEGDLLLELDDEYEERPDAIFERGERRRELESLVNELPESSLKMPCPNNLVTNQELHWIHPTIIRKAISRKKLPKIVNKRFFILNPLILRRGRSYNIRKCSTSNFWQH